jgi:hypothetical protein
MKVSLKSLTPPSVILRPVDLKGIDFTLLEDSIRKNGLLVPLTVCNGEIVDGYRRWLACKGLGYTEIDVHEVEGNAETLRIIAQSRETSFTRNEKKQVTGSYIANNREDHAGQIAHRFNWTIDEVEGYVGVHYLRKPWMQQYEAGKLSLYEVWHLSRLRADDQLSLWDETQTAYQESGTGNPEIGEMAAALHRRERTARRRSMVCRPRLKGYEAIKRELMQPTDAGLELIKAEAKTPLDGWIACLNWMLNSD